MSEVINFPPPLEPLGSKELKLYVEHHLIASKGGVELFQRVAENHPDPQVRTAVKLLVTEIIEDRQELLRIAYQLGIKPRRFQEQVMSWGEKLGRWKPNGRLISRSPLSDLLEIEALVDAVHAKNQGWYILEVCAHTDSRFNAEHIQSLQQRAMRQLDILHSLHLKTGKRFAPQL